MKKQRITRTGHMKHVTVILFIFLFLPCMNALAQDSAKFKPSGKLWGYAFGDYAYKLHADAAKRGNVQYSRLPKNYSSFNFRRIYLGYDYQFSPTISSQLLLSHESSFEANPDVVANNNSSIFIKAANIRFKNIIPQAEIVFGEQATPTFALLSDPVWGYRSNEKTITDMRGISLSTDLGLGVFGKIGKSENAGYDLLIGNGNGPKAENNKFKKIYTSVYAYFFGKKLIIQGNYEYETTSRQPGYFKGLTLLKAFVAYKTPATTIGLEVFEQLKTNHAIITGPANVPDTVNALAKGISLFFHQALKKDKLNLFARVDHYDPDTRFNALNSYEDDYQGNKEVFATIGLDIIPFNNIHIMPNLWYNQYHNKIQRQGVMIKNDYDLVARVTVYYIFR